VASGPTGSGIHNILGIGERVESGAFHAYFDDLIPNMWCLAPWKASRRAEKCDIINVIGKPAVK
jgi:hypothetical protein